MFDRQYLEHESDSETNRKRVFLYVLIGLFSGALIFISGFILGTNMEAKKVERFFKTQGSRTMTEEKVPETKEGQKPVIKDSKDVSTKDISIDKGKQKPEGKDLTFYQTLSSKRKKDSVGIESGKSLKKKSEPDSKIQGDKVSETQGKIYTVQVGAYTTMEIAEKVINNLKKKGYYAYIASKDVQGEGTLYKVWVGEFKDREKAEDQVKRIKAKEKIQAFVVLK